ncbi:alpha-beta hydrolase superfamily lysophospholipase [Natronocella acetinitrilica]|uniref:Alpha-beta hydrolase superfamily lysophospholipase n=1 Tax=Natronocella acetinitrilica TaxID=414046 RepID=A0AAE3G127_9GAMM|nr:alpha/beta hydrolase [Natronocella acetinitrilica]MCP1673681.1 alpha-beta hydrolase superfamily lysophospholipase [Natronocella acetinitrilica]
MPSHRLPSRFTLSRIVAPLLLVLALGACGSATTLPDMAEAVPADGAIVATDGFRLPLRQWEAEAPTRVVLAVHGFGDYGGGFEALAETLTAEGMTVYAYDQRGFGATGDRGLWAGQERMTQDLAEVADALRQRHPELPLYLVGKSMGGAVSILALTGTSPPPVDGVVLIAPAVWSRDTMPWYQRLGLELGTHLAPAMELSAELAVNLGVEPTDDPDVIEALREDPLVQRSARVDTIQGLTTLMGDAQAAALRLRGPALVLYGERDEIIPAEPTCLLFRKFANAGARDLRLALYPDGYHMLTRYTGADKVHADIAAWLKGVDQPLPSGSEVTRAEALERLCDDSIP